jgi:hypothetical protein
MDGKTEPLQMDAWANREMDGKTHGCHPIDAHGLGSAEPDSPPGSFQTPLFSSLADSVPATTSSFTIIIDFTVLRFFILYIETLFGVAADISTLRSRRVSYVVVIWTKSSNHQYSSTHSNGPPTDDPVVGF